MNLEELLSSGTKEVSDAVLTSFAKTEIINHPFSRRFERKMKQMIIRFNHPVFYQVTKSIACAVFVFLLSVSLVFASIPQAHAIAKKWFVHLYQTYFVIHIAGDHATFDTERDYTLTVIPAGYSLKEVIHNPDKKSCDIIYSGAHQELLVFYYASEREETIYFLNDGMSMEETVVGSDCAKLFYDPEGRHSNVLSWYDSKRNVFFSITAFAEQDELVRMAESVVEQ